MGIMGIIIYLLSFWLNLYVAYDINKFMFVKLT